MALFVSVLGIVVTIISIVISVHIYKKTKRKDAMPSQLTASVSFEINIKKD